jgi:hypothetical protein
MSCIMQLMMGMLGASSLLLIQPLLQVLHTSRAMTLGSGMTVTTPSPRVKLIGPKSFRSWIHIGQTCSLLLTVFGQKIQMFGMARVYVGFYLENSN